MCTHILLCRNYPYCLNTTFHSQAECDRDCHSESNRTLIFCTVCQENDDPDPHAIDIGTAAANNVDISHRTVQDDADVDEAAAGEASATNPEEQHATLRLRGGEGDSEGEGYSDAGSSLASAEDDVTYSDGETEASGVEDFEEERCPHCLAASRAAFEAQVRQVRNLLVRHGWTEFADVQAADVVADIRRRWERNREMIWREREARRERQTQRLLRMEREARARHVEREFEEYGEYEYEGEGGDEEYWDDDDESREEWGEEHDGEVMIFVLDDVDDEDADLEEGRRRGMARLRGGG